MNSSKKLLKETDCRSSFGHYCISCLLVSWHHLTVCLSWKVYTLSLKIKLVLEEAKWNFYFPNWLSRSINLLQWVVIQVESDPRCPRENNDRWDHSLSTDTD